MKSLAFILLLCCFELNAQRITILSDTVCEGEPTSLSASIDLNDTLIAAYNWDLDNDGYFDNATGKDIQYTFSGSDSFSIQLQVFTNDGRSFISDYFQVLIHPLPYADFTAFNLCTGDSTTLTNTSTIASADSLLLKWDFNNDGTLDSEDEEVTLLLDSSSQNISLVVLSEGGCSDRVSRELVLHSKPNSDFVFENSCRYDTVSFTNLSTIENDSIAYSVWNFGDSSLRISEHAEHAFLHAGVYPVSLVNISKYNCSDTLTRQIEIFELPEAEIEAGDTLLFPRDQVSLSVPSGSNNIYWSTGSNESVISVYAEGTYSVRVEDGNSCVNHDTITIYKLAINQKVIKSEVLTPNGDGINDFLEIKEIFRQYPCQVYIYDEWGQEVYRNSNYQNDWNCIHNGSFLNAGAYYYLVKLDQRNFRGCVNILR